MTNRITRQVLFPNIKTRPRESYDQNSQWITFLYMKSCPSLVQILGRGECQLRSKPIRSSEVRSKLSWYPSERTLTCLSMAGWGRP